MLIFLGIDGTPVYTAQSTDIADLKIVDCTIIGATVYLTDTNIWKIVAEDLTLVPYIFP